MKKFLWFLLVVVVLWWVTGVAYHFEFIQQDSSVGKLVAVVYDRVTTQTDTVKPDVSVDTDTPDEPVEQDVDSEPVSLEPAGSLSYTWKMEQPKYELLANWDMMKNGFSQPFEVTVDEIPDYYTKEDCPEFRVALPGSDYEMTDVPFDDVKNGLTVNANYVWPGFWLETTPAQEANFQDKWWMVFKPNQTSLLASKLDYSREYADSPNEFGQDEWVTLQERIGGLDNPVMRYPYNTPYISTDLLLHAYHKVFSTELQYYEQDKARPAMTKISQDMFDTMITKRDESTDEKEKQYFDFLAAYWSMPATFFVDNEVFLDNHSQKGQDMSDEELEMLIKKELSKYTSKLSDNYKLAVEKQVDEILKGEASRGNDFLMIAFGEETWEAERESGLTITQDYTQFVPRSHYTNNSLLKTYFMGMKSVMRHKLSFNSLDAIKAAFIATKVLEDDVVNQEKYDEFYMFINELIGSDDDINVYHLQDYMDQKWWKTVSDIVANATMEDAEALKKAVPQRIMGTHYTVNCPPGEQCATEDEAKAASAGFVMFGEKFTIDSWFFDELTAGEAEVEHEIKPSIHTAMIVPAHLENNVEAQNLTIDWLKRNLPEDAPFTKSQIAYQADFDSHTEILDEVVSFPYNETLYHRWLQMLSATTTKPDTMSPYFMADDDYRYKELTTYMGSYTELKHDTLLYVKQAYAEMGAGGIGDCFISHKLPPLPVPKWYVEPNADLINELMQLSAYTRTFFPDSSLKDFENYLEFLSKVLDAQANNKQLSDEDYEKLRLSYGTLSDVTKPRTYMGQPLSKEFRWSIIADIFTSWSHGPLYEAVGRPYMAAIAVNDVNGPRVVIGPVFSHYEFYNDKKLVPASAWRLTDEDWQEAYDDLSPETYKKIMGPSMRELVNIE